jgi:hypothetical protein
MGAGGMANLSYSSPVVMRCAFFENSGRYGTGAMHNNFFSDATVTSCIFIHNAASFGNAGGMYNYYSSPVVTGCTFSQNKGGYDAGAMFNRSSTTTVTNCILWEDLPCEIYNDGGSVPAVTYCCVQDGYAGTGNIKADPLFFDPDNGDLHLTWQSPCRESGNAAAAVDPEDFEGDPRIALGNVDMGADEFFFHLYHAGEVVPGSIIDILVVGIPGMTPVTLGLGSGIVDPPLATPYGPLYLALPLKGRWSLGTVPAEGVLVWPAKVPGNLAPGIPCPLQALVGRPGNPGSTLTNLLVLEFKKSHGDYRYDDGSTESNLLWTNGGDICWMHRFDVLPGGERILDVQTIFGCKPYPGYSPPNGTPCTVYVWDDPSDDGDPSDSILLASEPTAVQNVDTDIMNLIPLSTPATVFGEFYVGCCLTHDPGPLLPAPMDLTTPYVPGNAWICGTSVQGGFDPADLTNNEYPPADAGWYWCLRAGY